MPPKCSTPVRTAAATAFSSRMSVATGNEAVALGLANEALPAGEVLQHALRIAARFTLLAPGAVRESKRLLRAPLRDRIDAAIRAEAVVFSQRLMSAEAIESFKAFFEKRKPDFSKL